MSPASVVVVTCSLDELRALIREEVSRADPAPALPTPPLVDRRELARTLGVSAASVSRLTFDGMPCVYVGASPRYCPADVRTWLDARGQLGTKATPTHAPERLGGVRLLTRGGGR